MQSCLQVVFYIEMQAISRSLIIHERVELLKKLLDSFAFPEATVDSPLNVEPDNFPASKP